MVASAFCGSEARPVAEIPNILEIMTGRMRPRHRRFHKAFAALCHNLGLDSSLRPVTIQQRIRTQATTRLYGVRSLKFDTPNTLGLLHQALNRGSMPYIAEFDVPFALHGYDIQRHRRAHSQARRLLESPQLRTLLTFSDWASRSFGLHFGSLVEEKCRTVYPLAYEHAYCGNFDKRNYDFTFISTQFRIKCGPEAVKAFAQIQQSRFPKARFCVVTNLAQAKDLMGDLTAYPAIDWRESNLKESEIADLMAQTRCLVHPSLSDSFGVVVLEALAAGCAILSTNFASFNEMVSAENGWLVDAPTASVVGDSFIAEYGNTAYHADYLNTLSMHRFERTLANCMQEFLANTDQATQMMQASRSLYDSRFSLERWEQRMQSILQESFPELMLASA